MGKADLRRPPVAWREKPGRPELGREELELVTDARCAVRCCRSYEPQLVAVAASCSFEADLRKLQLLDDFL